MKETKIKVLKTSLILIVAVAIIAGIWLISNFNELHFMPNDEYTQIKEKLLGEWVSDSGKQKMSWHESDDKGLILTYTDEGSDYNRDIMIADLEYSYEKTSFNQGNVTYYEAAGEMTCMEHIYLNGDELYLLDGSDLHFVREGVNEVHLDHSRLYVETRMELCGLWQDSDKVNYFWFQGYSTNADFTIKIDSKESDKQYLLVVTDVIDTSDAKEFSGSDYDYVILATDDTNGSKIQIPVKKTDSGIDIYLNDKVYSLSN